MSLTLHYTVVGIVDPAKAGFKVDYYNTLYTFPLPTPLRKTTDSNGEVKRTWMVGKLPSIGNYWHVPGGQVIDGIEYGEYISETQIAYNDGEVLTFYLYPKPIGEVPEPDPDQWWEPDSTYREIEIQRWMPGTIAYGAWIDDAWIVRVSLTELQGLIDVWLGPEPPVNGEEPPVNGEEPPVDGVALGGIGLLILLWLILEGGK